MRKILAIIPLFFTISCGTNSKKHLTFTKTVIDGDTFITNEGSKVRILGIDTPESFDKNNNFDSTQGVRKLYASRAKKFSENWLLHKKINITYCGKDKYDRTLGIVTDNKTNLGVQLVENGLAIVQYISVDPKSPFYSTEFSYYQQLLRAQYVAQVYKKGIYENPRLMNIIFPK